MRDSSPATKPDSLAGSPSESYRFSLGLLLAGLTFVCYLPAVYGGFIWDDPEHVVDNKNLRTAEGLVAIWTQPRTSPQYYPLVHTTFWLEYRLWGLNPKGYHLTNRPECPGCIKSVQRAPFETPTHR